VSGVSAASPWLPKCVALCIGVGSFDEGVSEWEDLPFASDKAGDGRPSSAEQVAGALRRFGFTPQLRHDATVEEIGDAVRQVLTLPASECDLAIVHLVGHGKEYPPGRLRFIDRTGRGLDIDSLIADAQETSSGPRVVFLLDVCGAGTAAGSFWSSELGQERRVWALGACTSTATTQHGRFSSAIAHAVHALADTDFPTIAEPISFAQFSRALIASKNEAGCGRISLNFHLEQGDGDWPMLPNPLTVFGTVEHGAWAVRAQQYLPGLDIGALIAALERGADIDDTAHFADRASGRALAPGDLRLACSPVVARS
jgi:caspase domain-containing protein